MGRFVVVLGLFGLLAAARVAEAGERVDVTAMDGVQLMAALDGTTGPGVVLVDDAADDPRGWQSAADGIVARGFRVLRLDLRGHGASGEVADLGVADRDVEGAYRYLLGRKIRPVVLVAKGAAGAAAVRVAARVPIAGVALVAAADADATTLTVPVLHLANVSDPEALARLTSWLASLH